MPKSYYLKVVKPSTNSYMTSLSVSKGSKKKLEFQITTTNSLLKYGKYNLINLIHGFC